MGQVFAGHSAFSTVVPAVPHPGVKPVSHPGGHRDDSGETALDRAIEAGDLIGPHWTCTLLGFRQDTTNASLPWSQSCNLQLVHARDEATPAVECYREAEQVPLLSTKALLSSSLPMPVLHLGPAISGLCLRSLQPSCGCRPSPSKAQDQSGGSRAHPRGCSWGQTLRRRSKRPWRSESSQLLSMHWTARGCSSVSTCQFFMSYNM